VSVAYMNEEPFNINACRHYIRLLAVIVPNPHS